ncbi:MAG: hypothetical protein ABFR89_02395 [Actinomycetota bacterium]
MNRFNGHQAYDLSKKHTYFVHGASLSYIQLQGRESGEVQLGLAMTFNARPPHGKTTKEMTFILPPGQDIDFAALTGQAVAEHHGMLQVEEAEAFDDDELDDNEVE